MQILSALENLVFIVRKDEEGNNRTEEIKGKSVYDIYPKVTADYITQYQELAFKGQNVSNLAHNLNL